MIETIWVIYVILVIMDSLVIYFFYYSIYYRGERVNSEFNVTSPYYSTKRFLLNSLKFWGEKGRKMEEDGKERLLVREGEEA